LARHLKECLRDGAFQNVRILVSGSVLRYSIFDTYCLFIALCKSGSWSSCFQKCRVRM